MIFRMSILLFSHWLSLVFGARLSPRRNFIPRSRTMCQAVKLGELDGMHVRSCWMCSSMAALAEQRSRSRTSVGARPRGLRLQGAVQPRPAPGASNRGTAMHTRYVLDHHLFLTRVGYFADQRDLPEPPARRRTREGAANRRRRSRRRHVEPVAEVDRETQTRRGWQSVWEQVVPSVYRIRARVLTASARSRLSVGRTTCSLSEPVTVTPARTGRAMRRFSRRFASDLRQPPVARTLAYWKHRVTYISADTPPHPRPHGRLALLLRPPRSAPSLVTACASLASSPPASRRLCPRHRHSRHCGTALAHVYTY